jgi:hypothetical protein
MPIKQRNKKERQITIDYHRHEVVPVGKTISRRCRAFDQHRSMYEIHPDVSRQLK